MGSFAHHAMIVTGWYGQGEIIEAHQCAHHIFGNVGLSGLVTPVIAHAANGGSSFFISPSGSKQGWETDQRYNDARRSLANRLKDVVGVECVTVRIGGDDGEYGVIDPLFEDDEC